MKKEQTKKINTDFSSTELTENHTEYASVEAKLKKQHGEITKIEFNVDGKKLTAYLRQPSLAELDATIATLSLAPISSSVGLFRSCFVGGDDELINMADNAGLAVAINREIQKTIPNVLATSTKV